MQPPPAPPNAPESPDPALRLTERWERGGRPGLREFLDEVGTIPPEQLADVLAVDRRQRWQVGEPVLAETYLRQFPALAADPGLALDLIYGEFLLRQQLGDAPQPQEYLDRFPEHAEQLQLQFELNQALGVATVREAAGPPGAPPTVPPGAFGPDAAPGGLPSNPGYEVLGLLGRGGMGVVYKARQIALKRLVALKMIRAGERAGEEELARFRAEAEALARLRHPNIVQVYEVGQHEGLPFFSLELVEGGSLDRQLAGAPQPPRRAAELVQTLARAVHAAHQAGVIHRDLKPANVLLTRDGTPKITDFGLAKQVALPGDAEPSIGQTATGAILGSPAYMAPEQAAGKTREIGPAADVWALGVILYEMLTGRPPSVANRR